MLKTSSTIESGKNLSWFIDMADNTEIGIISGNYEDKTVEKSPPTFKNLNRVGYLIFSARVTFTQLKKAFTKTSIL